MNTKKNQKLVSSFKSVITTPRYLLKSISNKSSYHFRAVARVALMFFLILGSAFRLQAQAVNESHYITFEVKNGENIKFNFLANAVSVPIKIVSGANEYNLTIGTNWTQFDNCEAGADTMTIYGDVFLLDCAGNNANITGLDASHNNVLSGIWCSNNQISYLNVSLNTELEKLICDNNNLNSLDVSKNPKLRVFYCAKNQLTTLDISKNPKLELVKCYGNKFSTEVIDVLFCSLPYRGGLLAGTLYVLNNTSDVNYADVLEANKENAADNNWVPVYWDNYSGDLFNTPIPATTGTYVCGSIGGEVNMERYITITVESGAEIKLDLKADADNTPIRIVSGSLDTTLIVDYNWTEFADYTAGTDSMTVYGELFGLDCGNNGTKLTGLDANQNTELTKLYCYGNQISSLDISQNTNLEVFACDNNQISSLDFSQNAKLKFVRCYNNPLATRAIDEIFCSLPNRETTDNAILYIANNADDANHSDLLVTNSQNAITKNWNVWYFDNYSGALHNNDIPTTGDYDCNSNSSEVYLSDLILYPNPVTTGFTIETQERGILEIYSVAGQKVGSTTITNSKQFINTSSLKSGIYIAKINGRVVKFAKR